VVRKNSPLYFIILGSDISKSLSFLSKERILIPLPSSNTGKLTLSFYCNGRSATLSKSHILLLNLKTPGFRRHSIINPSLLGLMFFGDKIGFSLNLSAISILQQSIDFTIVG